MKLAALLVLVSGAARAQDMCPLPAEPEPRTFEEEGRVVWFKQPVDRTWFTCARAAGGTLTLQFLAGAPGAMEPLPAAKKLTSANISEGAYHSNNLCDKKPAPSKIQVQLTGTGPMERLTWTSEAIDLSCPRCEYRSYETSLATFFNKDPISIELGLGAAWHACARPGSKLQMRLYVGKSREQVESALQPDFVLPGLEASPKVKRTIPRALLCAGSPSYIAFEFFGTGEMREMRGWGRSAVEIRCK